MAMQSPFRSPKAPTLLPAVALLVLGVLALACAQETEAPQQAVSNDTSIGIPALSTPCGNEYQPASQPTNTSKPVVLAFELCFGDAGTTPRIEVETYFDRIQLPSFLSEPSRDHWVPYDETVRRAAADDSKRLTALPSLGDVRIEVTDYVFPNGAIGKVFTYHLEERAPAS
jgi:hypothetical protein